MALAKLSLTIQTLYAELLDRAEMAAFDADFPENGSFSRRIRGERAYWYFNGYDDGRRTVKYVGPDTEEVRSRIARHRIDKIELKGRRRLVAALTGAGLPETDRITGDVLEAMARAGLFRLRAVLVGTVAYQAYSALLGVLLPAALTRTGDVDVAKFHSIAVALDDSTPPLGEVLKSVDASFRPVAGLDRKQSAWAFRNADGFRVEFLTPNRASDEWGAKPVRLPSLGEMAAQPLRFLDFLIHRPVRAALLHGGGVAVAVPAAERYAVHKLIVASRRADGGVKAPKDLAQAGALIEALAERRPFELAEAWAEASARGPKWRSALARSRSLLAPEQEDALTRSLARID